MGVVSNKMRAWVCLHMGNIFIYSRFSLIPHKLYPCHNLYPSLSFITLLLSSIPHLSPLCLSLRLALSLRYAGSFHHLQNRIIADKRQLQLSVISLHCVYQGALPMFTVPPNYHTQVKSLLHLTQPCWIREGLHPTGLKRSIHIRDESAVIRLEHTHTCVCEQGNTFSSHMVLVKSDPHSNLLTSSGLFGYWTYMHTELTTA